MNDLYIDIEHALGAVAHKYNPAHLHELIMALGKRTIQACNLTKYAKSITFTELCEYIKAFISTPFGVKALREIQSNIY